MAKEIKDLPATPGLASTDLLATKKGLADYKATIAQLSTLIRGDITGKAVLDLVKTVDSDLSGLNANTLQGANKSFFQNAANLTSGTIPNARLPAGSVTSYGTTAWAQKIIIPEFLLGQRIMIQFGVTAYALESRRVSITFPTPFVSGFGTQNIPLFQVTPECRTGSFSVSRPFEEVEVDIRAYDVSLTTARLATIRTFGSGSDEVRGHWWAIGKY